MAKDFVFYRLNQSINKDVSDSFCSFFEKIKEKPEIKYIYLMINSPGGDLGCASRMINTMNINEVKVIGIAYKSVHSAAIPVFLSTHVRFGYQQATALIHRSQKSTGVHITDEELRASEKQIFELISEKLGISLNDVEALADANGGKGTYLSMNHPLGKKFFIGH